MSIPTDTAFYSNNCAAMEKENSFPFEKVLVVIFSLLLLCQYRFSYGTWILENNPQFELLEPANSTLPQVEDDYSQLLDLQNFSFLINPPVCNEFTEGLLLIIVVSSNPKNHKNRDLIRKTWGQLTESTKLVFLVGMPSENFTLEDNTTLADQIQTESFLYGDIVQGSFLDAYRNLTYKHVMGLKWVAHHCPTAKYVLKTDDDMIVYTEALVNFLVRDLSPWGAKRLIICDVCVHAEVFRKDSKWSVTKEEYADDYYPPYCSGYVILYSQDVVRQLVNASQTVRYFWIDDVMVTGVLAQSIGIERTFSHTLSLTRRRASVLKKKGSKYVGRFLFGSRDMNLNDMLKVWQARGI